MPSKRARIQLDTEAYHQLRREVLQPDARRCQNCGSRENLQVHHKQFRSKSGDDSDENLITHLSFSGGAVRHCLIRLTYMAFLSYCRYYDMML